MKLTFLITFIFSCIYINAHAQHPVFTGRILDETNLPVHGANVRMVEEDIVTVTDPFGYFSLVPLKDEFLLEVSHIGFKTRLIPINSKSHEGFELTLEEGELELEEVSISANKEREVNLISAIDLQLRPVNNAQEILRAVPGLFIAQHAGGGKAEQIFLRGFDIDHGTDITLSVDGIPINMVSHAHGQGYSDLHFIIPETIEQLHFEKGPYYANKGNFNTAGFAEYQTKKTLDRNMLKLEAGAFGTFRTVGMINILPEKMQEKHQHAYLAGEFFRSDGYFESPQDFKRMNFLGKYHGKVGNNSWLTATVSNFYSQWMASGQIPERAVKSGEITRFGAIDDTEGGETSRQNVNLKFMHKTGDQGWLSHQIYYSHYDFELYSNFTFFLNDPENGDQIRQKEERNLFGYTSEYRRHFHLAGLTVSSTSGIGFRYDDVNDNELSSTINRSFTKERISLGDVNEGNVFAYGDLTWPLASKLNMTTGLRLDYFQFNYQDKLAQTESDKNHLLLSPKLNFDYVLNNKITFYLKSGIGFHSNDSRVAVTKENRAETLPRAYGIDLGGLIKPTPHFILEWTLWALKLDQEFVYVGDEGIVEPSGKTFRTGIETSLRYQINPKLFADVDFTLTRARATEEEEHEAYIPLAPNFTSTGGITWKVSKGLSGSLRYRYLHDRPANEDNSLVAKGYFISDAVINYTIENFQFGASVENIFNTEWNEAQFATTSRLKNEPAPVTEIHFTPGTPVFVKGSITYSF
ncbi:TonB-dependent receptor [Flexithrix dorotheae]|uniref:TonB-dependent receptor n=1 Tax=Flexithrix dorotheae TaxID=70993 RepID=UPI00037A3BE2|nr:TonB-dependent receptor [Flexithrix dorotheae]